MGNSGGHRRVHKRTQWTAAVEAKARELNHYRTFSWGLAATGKRRCVACGAKTFSLACSKCYNGELKKLATLKAYRDYVYQHTARVRSLSDPALMGYRRNGRGAW